MNWRRILKISGIIAAVFGLAFVGFIAWFGYLMGQFEDVEVARFPNPSGSMEAVVVERHGNATVALTTLIYIVPSKMKVPEYPHFLADYVDDLVIDWKDDQNVEIRATNARVSQIEYYFSNKPAIGLGNIRYKISSIGNLPD